MLCQNLTYPSYTKELILLSFQDTCFWYSLLFLVVQGNKLMVTPRVNNSIQTVFVFQFSLYLVASYTISFYSFVYEVTCVRSLLCSYIVHKLWCMRFQIIKEDKNQLLKNLRYHFKLFIVSFIISYITMWNHYQNSLKGCI